MEEIKTSKELHDNIVDNHNVVVKVGSECCGPCNQTELTISGLEDDYENIKFLKIDVDNCDEALIDELNIMSIPVILYYKNANLVEKTIGSQSKIQLKEKFINNFKD